MMDGKGVPGSPVGINEEQKESFDLLFFKVSCALYAIRLFTESKLFDANWLETRNGMLLGSAHLLGLLAGGFRKGEDGIGKAKLLHKLENAQKEIGELKSLRSEDAKANEKVVSMYATKEQGWFSERKKLRQHIVALMNGLKFLETKKNNYISGLKEKLQEKEALLVSKEKAIEDEEQMRHGLEDRLRGTENVVEELKESAKLEAQRHSNEILKHKSAFIELVSNQRQLEAEMGRALRQVESAKQQIDVILEQKEQAVLMTQKLSLELVKVRRDLEQKDQILSAMLRKSKLDTAEKQMLLEEMKLSKAKRKQAEIKAEKVKNDSESRSEKHSLRSMLSAKFDALSGAKGHHPNASMASNTETARSHQINFMIEFEQPEFLPGPDQYTSDGYQDPTNSKHLDAWVRTQAEKYGNAVDLRHHFEVDAFAEQLRLKDEKLEAFRWRLLSMELESKKMKAHFEGLDRDLMQLRRENMKLEALLLNREAELQSLREKLALKVPYYTTQKDSLNTHPQDTAWSNITTRKKNLGEEVQEISVITESSHYKVEEEQDKNLASTQQKDIVLLLQSPEKESEDDEDDAISPAYIQDTSPHDSEKAEASSSVVKYMTNTNNSPWKLDIHALGVSYKIQRLKQQLLMLEKLAGKQESPVGSEGTDSYEDDMKSFFALLSILNRQIGRYLSLQGKTDDICQRMHENDLFGKGGKYNAAAKSKEETRLLEHYLEETFQLQRYMVASGQKLMELQAKISTGFMNIANELDVPATFDMRRFADSIRNLFGEVQRGLEVRISRIIGDLEGTLACDGIIHFKR